MMPKRMLLLFFTFSFLQLSLLLFCLILIKPSISTLILSLYSWEGIRQIGLVLLLIIGHSIAASLFVYRQLFKDEEVFQKKLTALIKKDFTTFDALALNDNKKGPILVNESLNELALAIKRSEKQKQELAINQQELSGMHEAEVIKKERQRIARELHDSVSQQLFAMTMLLSAIETQNQNLPEETQALLQKVIHMVNSAQAEMRALLLHLRPINLIDATLHEGIQRLFDELDTKVALKLETRLEPVHATAEVEDNLFRMTQELLSNSLRHAKASTIECELYDHDQMIILRFIDNGTGFDPTKIEQGTGYGLQNIAERIEQLGGTLNIMSEEAKGAVIEIQVPK